MSNAKKNTVDVKAAAAPHAATNAVPPSIPPLPAALQTSGAVTLPLTDEQHDAYQALYDEYEVSIESLPDGDLKTSVQASQDAVGDILEQDNEEYLNQNTGTYQALLKKINGTNTDLKALQKQIAAIAGKVSTFGTILNAINKVLGLVGVV